MKHYIHKITGVALLLMALSFHASAQNLDIDFIEFNGRNIVVHYTLDDGANSNRQFLVQIYSSQDNYTTALTRVSGDVGSEVSSGFDKKIVWDITKELGSYKGEVQLEIRGRVYVPFVKISGIDEETVYKRGKNYPINWTSGNLSGQVNIELYNSDNERLWGESNVANVGKYDWYIPGNIKKGSDYTLKFTNARDRNDVVYSRAFTIKPRIPFIVKAVGVLTIAAVVPVVLLTKEKETTEKEKPLENPINPPGN